ncbi:decarboxylase [Streptomyces sp. DSM 110735]|uniref:aspartate racemase/maleate isomerase family protein n=1 Tax=Streptomyces sp. DSM 110735 TaxID=2775031 RepID=UPI0018F2AB88|nr:decarboxylase [Streptomyces sp. DSM 110735]MBJ7905119.1 decarboxylase [Streptomyces sp. DSM 110735]
MTALGLLCTDHRGEDDYPRIEQLLGSDVRVDLVRLDPGAGITGAAEELRLSGADAVVRTGEGFTHDAEDEANRVEELARQTGMPASSTALAFVNAARDLGATRVAVAAPAGTHEDTARLRGFLRAGGLEVTGTHTAESGGDEDALLALVTAADTPDAEAVLLTDPALEAAAQVPALEKAVGKPVLTASQVTVWEGLRLAERRVHAPDLGALFTRTPASEL